MRAHVHVETSLFLREFYGRAPARMTKRSAASVRAGFAV